MGAALIVALVAACADEGAGGIDAVETIEADAHGEDVAGDQADGSDGSDGSEDSDGADQAEVDDADEVPVLPERTPGERAPLTARCDESEPARCLLPWPSSAFLARDEASDSGVRLQVEADVLPPDEGTALLDGADGFSRVTPILTILPPGLTADQVRVRLFVAEPGESFASEIAIDTWVAPGREVDDAAVVIGYPLAPLPAASEHLVIVESDDGAPDGSAPAVRAAQVALGEATPATRREAERLAYFAPARAIAAARGIDAARVIALWDFVTRSADDPRAALMRLAESVKRQVDDGSARITIARATLGEAPIALIVEGEIGGLVDTTTPDGLVYGVPFRVVVPSGEGDYRVALYGHGTGGDVSDASFDTLITGAGAAKVNVEIDGWTGDTVGGGLSGLLVPIVGTDALVQRMRRAIAGIAAIQQAVLGPLGDLLAAPTLLGVDNPEAGRRPMAALPIWTGGSLGGVIGCVYGHLEPTIAGGVLNVPGAAFTHWLARSSIGGVLDLALKNRYPAMVDQQLVAAMAQTLWDEVDGAVWADAREVAPIWLVQMSVGDPIMPNNATAMVASAVEAVMLVPDGVAPLVPVHGLEAAPVAVGRSALTEFVTEETGNSAIHGFTARDSAAGIAARAQVEAFIHSLWQGAPEIRIPEACMALPTPGICDFAAP